MKDEPTPQEWQAWADEAQACVDSGDVVISDHRKAQATITALREHAILKARIAVLEGHLTAILAAEKDFSGAMRAMDPQWEGDPLTDACDEARKYLNPEQPK